VVAPRDAAGLAMEPRAMADGTQAADLRFDDCVLPASAVIVRGNRAPEILNTTLAWAHVSISAELFGLATALFGMTIDYLHARTQFDAPLASFQALQHRAADLYCGKEIARFNIAQAASALETANGAALATASRCKARAADAAMQIAREAVQLHGAIGFSDEADVGLYLKRIMVLAAWLGGADHHRRQYARLNPYRLD
jgi:alkylation response protein AidB-like acyl-CoA dehydrogenase